MESRFIDFILAVEDVFLKSPSDVVTMLQFHQKYVRDPKIQDVLIKAIKLHRNDSDLVRYINRYLCLIRCQEANTTLQKGLFKSTTSDVYYPHIPWSKPSLNPPNWIAEETRDIITSHLKNQPSTWDVEWWELLSIFYEYSLFFSLENLSQEILSRFDNSKLPSQNRLYLSSLLMNSNIIRENQLLWEKESLLFLNCLWKLIDSNYNLIELDSIIPEDLFVLKFDSKVLGKMDWLAGKLDSKDIDLSFDTLKLYSFLKCIQNRDNSQLIENPSKFLDNKIGKGMDKHPYAIEGLIFALETPFFENTSRRKILNWLLKNRKKMFKHITHLSSSLAYAYLHNDLNLFRNIERLRNDEWRRIHSLFKIEDNYIVIQTYRLPKSLDLENMSLMLFSVLESMERYFFNQ